MTYAIRIGSEKQLFVDRKFIESSDGITLSMNPPYQTGEKSTTTDQPWELDGHVSHGSAFKEETNEGAKVRLWYVARKRHRSKAAWSETSDISPLAGRSVRLHFAMRACKIYAFQFRSSETS